LQMLIDSLVILLWWGSKLEENWLQCKLQVSTNLYYGNGISSSLKSYLLFYLTQELNITIF
jgi:hypothetical protein